MQISELSIGSCWSSMRPLLARVAIRLSSPHNRSFFKIDFHLIHRNARQDDLEFHHDTKYGCLQLELHPPEMPPTP